VNPATTLGERVTALAAQAGLAGGRVIWDNAPGHEYPIRVNWEHATLLLASDAGRLVATVERPPQRPLVLNASAHWTADTPENDKLLLYLQAFHAHIKGRPADPKAPR